MSADDRSRGRSTDEPVYVISVAADLAGMHPQTLRGWERKGLLHPGRSIGNSRRYSDHDVERLQEIQRLTQDEGVNIAGVRMVMELRDQLERARTRIRELEVQLDAYAQRLREEVEAAHRSHRYEFVPVPPRALEPHPYIRTRLGERPR